MEKEKAESDTTNSNFKATLDTTSTTDIFSWQGLSYSVPTEGHSYLHEHGARTACACSCNAQSGPCNVCAYIISFVQSVRALFVQFLSVASSCTASYISDRRRRRWSDPSSKYHMTVHVASRRHRRKSITTYYVVIFCCFCCCSAIAVIDLGYHPNSNHVLWYPRKSSYLYCSSLRYCGWVLYSHYWRVTVVLWLGHLIFVLNIVGASYRVCMEFRHVRASLYNVRASLYNVRASLCNA